MPILQALVLSIMASALPSAFAKDRVLIGQKDIVGVEEQLENLVVIGGQVEVHGTVETLVAIGSHVGLRSTSRVTHQLVRIGSDVMVEPGAEISAEDQVSVFSGQLSSQKSGQFDWQGRLLIEEGKSWTEMKWLKWWGQGWSTLFRMVFFLVFAWLAYEFSPTLQQNIHFTVKKNPLLSMVMGFFFSIVVVMTSVLLVVSLVGIIALPFFFLFLILMVGFGYLHIAQAVGEWIPILRTFKSPYLAIVVGILCLEALRWFPIVGSLSWLLYFMGLGAAILSFQGGRRIVIVKSRS